MKTKNTTTQKAVEANIHTEIFQVGGQECKPFEVACRYVKNGKSKLYFVCDFIKDLGNKVSKIVEQLHHITRVKNNLNNNVQHRKVLAAEHLKTLFKACTGTAKYSVITQAACCPASDKKTCGTKKATATKKTATKQKIQN